MANYKVAQDVEADDKLIGPFSFRQFIYLIVVAMAGAIAWGMWQIFPPLAILPLPVMIFFGLLALPLRKDQPMETYMAAIISFYLKPKRRLWQPDGVQSLVEITAPKNVEESRTKDLSGNEAERRLGYLAAIADTQGWSIRNASMPDNSSSMVGDVYNEAQRTPDLLDESGGVAQSFNSMISRSDAERRKHMLEQMHSPQPSQPVTPTQPQPPSQIVDEPKLQFDPYPNSMRQTVVSPMSSQPDSQPPQAAPQSNPPVDRLQQPAATPTPKSTSETPVSPDIINLANNSHHLSIETLAHEAKRIENKGKHDDGEVVISLR